MRPASFTHLLTKPALLIAAGLVLLGATAGRDAPAALGGASSAERGVGTSSCRATKPSFDALCRCLGVSFTSEEDGGFSHVGLHAAFAPTGARLVGEPGVCVAVQPCEIPLSRTRLRQCAVGPSPPV